MAFAARFFPAASAKHKNEYEAGRRTMLLALDVGNSNTVLGLFRLATDGTPAQLIADWRITTPYKQTADELGVLFQTLFSMRGLRQDEVTGIAISSVVPPLDATMRRVSESFFRIRPLFI